VAPSSDPAFHTTLHRVFLILGDELEIGDSRRLSDRQIAAVLEGLDSYFKERRSATREGARPQVAISERRHGRVDLLAQMLLYYQSVAIPDPLSDWVSLGGPASFHPEAFEEMLQRHHWLDELASRGVVEFFVADDDRDEDYFAEAAYLARDASFARAVLGRLPVSDTVWERDLRDPDDVSDQEYMSWSLERTDLAEPYESVIVAALDVLPRLDATAKMGARLIPRNETERHLTTEFAKAVASRMEDRAVSSLASVPIPFLDGLTPGEAVAMRGQDATWHQWQTALTSLLMQAETTSQGDSLLNAEIVDVELRGWAERVGRASNRSSLAKRVLIESTTMDVFAATMSAVITGRLVAGVPAALKGLLTPAFRAHVHTGPAGADAVLLSLRSK
jgi:hypothetical protein